MNLICEKSVIKQAISRCMYCNSTSYGKGCRYAPGGVHFHPNDPKKCSYCGSTSFGNGCKLNPFDNLHLHGINYNSMFKESLKNNFIIEQLNKDYKDYEAYKLGIIDENGNKIKEPITEAEKNAYSPTSKTFLKIKKYLGPKWDLIHSMIVLESESKIEYNKGNHQKFLDFETKIQNLITQLHELTNEALSEGLTLEQVESFFK
jgi:hypothetical protein